MNHAGSLFVPDHRRLQSRCEQAPQEAQLPPQACLPALWSRIMPRITRKQARAMTAIRTRLIQLCANQSAISGDLLSRSRRSGTDAAFFDRLCRFLHFIQEVRKSQASRFPAVWAGSLRSQPKLQEHRDRIVLSERSAYWIPCRAGRACRRCTPEAQRLRSGRSPAYRRRRAGRSDR